MKGSSLKYLTREGFRNIWVNRMMSLASVAVLMACLIIIGIGAMAYFNINSLLNIVESQNIVMVYVSEDADDLATSELKLSLESLDNVASCEFVPKEDAFQHQVELMGGDSALFDGFKTSPLPDAYKVTVKDLSKFTETVTAIKALDNVYSVRENSDLATKLVSIRRAVTIVSAGLVLMLFLVALFIISNTIRITMFSRKLEINIMKAVGATNSFIRLPFVVEGLVLGILGGGLAFLAEWGLYNLVTGKLVASVTESFITFVPFHSVALEVFIVYMAVGILVGAFGGVNAIRNYLKV